MADSSTATTSHLVEITALNARRESLHLAITGLQDALETPTGDAELWRLRVAMAVDHAAARLSDHIDQTDSTSGLLARATDVEPRLARRVAQLRVDHERLEIGLDALAQALSNVDDEELEIQTYRLRGQTADLLEELIGHRQRGSDLLAEAFNLDFGQSA